MSLNFYSLHTAFRHPRLLPSSTEGIEFDAMFEVKWTPRSRGGSGLLDSMKADVVSVAAAVSRSCSAHDVRAAQNVVNSELAAWGQTSAPQYRRISPKVSLSLSEQAIETLAQRRADEERVRRLTFLKNHLYSDPVLVVLEQLERSPGQNSDALLEDYLRAARLIRSSDEWWSPLLAGGEALAQHVGHRELAAYFMQALTDTVTNLLEPQTPSEPVRPSLSLPAEAGANGGGFVRGRGGEEGQ